MRRVFVSGLIGSTLMLGNILFVANWLAERDLADWARGLRSEYLTGTAMAVIAVLLILLVSPKGYAVSLVRRCVPGAPRLSTRLG